MKYETKQYLCFFYLGLCAYLSYHCVLAQSNYWIHFYS